MSNSKAKPKKLSKYDHLAIIIHRLLDAGLIYLFVLVAFFLGFSWIALNAMGEDNSYAFVNSLISYKGVLLTGWPVAIAQLFIWRGALLHMKKKHEKELSDVQNDRDNAINTLKEKQETLDLKEQ